MDIKKMRFGMLKAKGVTEIRERALPEMGEFDVLIKQETCNICTTDYGQFSGLREHQGYPMAGGHEGSGIIIEKGRKVKGYEIGDRVALLYDACGRCDMCKSGQEGRCADADILDKFSEDGYKGFFGFADYMVVPSRRIAKINKDLPSAEAGFLEPLATVVKGVKLVKAKPNETIAVIGAGTMGLLNALTLKAYGCKVILTESFDNKLENAKALGFDVIDIKKEDPVEGVMRLTNGKGVDAVVVAVGNSAANNQSVKMLKEAYGRILVFAAGYPEPNFDISSNLIHYKRMEIIGTFSADYIDFMDAAELLNSGAVKVTNLLEPKTFKLDDFKEALEYASIPGKYRVTVEL